MGDQVRGLEAALRRASGVVDVRGTPRSQEWGVAEAWDALLTHLGQYDAEARVDGGEVRAVRGAEETVYRIATEDWAARRTDVHRQETHR